MGAGGIMFDRQVVEALLLYAVPFYPKGTQVELSDGRQGIIVVKIRETVIYGRC